MKDGKDEAKSRAGTTQMLGNLVHNTICCGIPWQITNTVRAQIEIW
jgi:hypothetical protein